MSVALSHSRAPKEPISRTALTDPVQTVSGVGEKRASALEEAGIKTVGDLLGHIPRMYLDRSVPLPTGNAIPGQNATVLGTVRRTTVHRGRPGRFEMTLGDETGFLKCVWFGDKWMRGLRNRFSAGDLLLVSGKVAFFNGKQIVTPDYDILTEQGDDTLHTGRVIPVYPSTATLREAGLDSRGFRRIIKPLLDRIEAYIPETLPEAIRAQGGLLPRRQAIGNAHFPESLDAAEKARERLAFDELFYLELLLALRKYRLEHRSSGIAFARKSPLARAMVEGLPFRLTEAQKRVLREIHTDMSAPRPMNRLLQGDVGSGKTVVAAIAMLLAMESGYQSALMAPTEILAEQHATALKSLFGDLGVQTVFLSGSLPAGERRARLDALADGRAHIAIGTHALIQETVRFHRLGLVVIDEQHRFGVTQRALLREKGQTPDALVMTATPIPRTLALTTYGDLDVSILDELPPGRKPITTRWISENRRDEAYRLMREEIEKGRQVYVVCPLIEESEKSDLKAAEIIAETLRNAVFSDRKVGLLHGRMKGDEKDGVMQTFKQGGYDILVSTTVIEVGIDVPNATVMVVEHAERFGLAQLHQLRGRVGRGENASFCVLINGLDPGAPIPDDTLARLTIMTETQDGFRIAEEDLRIRGPGEFLGTRQHGLPGLRVADVIKDGELLQMARQAAFHLVEQDPDLSAADHRIVRSILNQNYADLIDWIGVG